MTTELIEACAMRLYDGLRPDHALPWDACERAARAVIPLVLDAAAEFVPQFYRHPILALKPEAQS